MAGGEPRTSAALAKEASLSERYVREWLGAMTTGGIVIYDATSRTYVLPREHAALLTRASPTSLASTAQWIGVLGAAEDHVAAAFVHGRGVPYERYGRFNEVMADESALTTLAGLDDHIIPHVEGLHEKLTRGINLVDIGCGEGRAIIHLAKRYPKSRFHGLDIQPSTVAAGNALARSKRLTNVRFEVQDLTTWNGLNAFDVVTAFDAIHDQARPDLVLANIRAALKHDGIFLMQDIKASSRLEQNADHPLAPFIYTISCMHCMSVSLAQGGVGLGAAWERELAEEMVRKAGFGEVSVSELPHDMLNLYYVCRP